MERSLKRLSLRLAATGLAFAAALSPAFAQPTLSPVGQWQATNGEARYEITTCGDGDQLCARLTWLSPEARTDENLQYLNEYVVSGADRAAANKWRGTVHYDGRTISGSLTLVDEDYLKVQGCQIIMCQSMEFVRI